ncbi:uncharacterized protein LOC127870161 [Dreissena polymorpha]|uniref:uncharacterized protein LOC127870161 n=1 Tax=Dreissena polymorpha TaxID=45954 RepID=UPI002263C2BE|nr:uncharacterized protein LOC127870161 [Dreissena polymorpha]
MMDPNVQLVMRGYRKKSKEALQEILEPFAGVTTECLQEWIDYERVVCIRSKSTENHSLSPAEEYCLVLEELTKYRGVFATDVNKDKKRLETKLKKKGKKAGVKWDSTNVDYLRTLKTAQEKLRLQILETLQQTTAERLFLLDLMKKYARGQAVAIRLGKQLKQTNKKIREQLSLYNAVGGEVVKMPTHLSFEDVKSCDSKLWDILKSSDVGAWRTSVPVSVKQQAVRLFCMTQSCRRKGTFDFRNEVNITFLFQ